MAGQTHQIPDNEGSPPGNQQQRMESRLAALQASAVRLERTVRWAEAQHEGLSAAATAAGTLDACGSSRDTLERLEAERAALQSDLQGPLAALAALSNSLAGLKIQASHELLGASSAAEAGEGSNNGLDVAAICNKALADVDSLIEQRATPLFEAVSHHLRVKIAQLLEVASRQPALKSATKGAQAGTRAGQVDKTTSGKQPDTDARSNRDQRSSRENMSAPASSSKAPVQAASASSCSLDDSLSDTSPTSSSAALQHVKQQAQAKPSPGSAAHPARASPHPDSSPEFAGALRAPRQQRPRTAGPHVGRERPQSALGMRASMPLQPAHARMVSRSPSPPRSGAVSPTRSQQFYPERPLSSPPRSRHNLQPVVMLRYDEWRTPLERMSAGLPARAREWKDPRRGWGLSGILAQQQEALDWQVQEQAEALSRQREAEAQRRWQRQQQQVYSNSSRPVAAGVHAERLEYRPQSALVLSHRSGSAPGAKDTTLAVTYPSTVGTIVGPHVHRRAPPEDNNDRSNAGGARIAQKKSAQQPSHPPSASRPVASAAWPQQAVNGHHQELGRRSSGTGSAAVAGVAASAAVKDKPAVKYYHGGSGNGSSVFWLRQR